MEIDSRDVDIGSQLNISPTRRVIVMDNQPDGLVVMYYTSEAEGGTGPHWAVLPHAKLHKHQYIDERAGVRGHYSNWHPDFTGKSGEV